MSTYLYRLARWSFRRRRIVLAIWLLLAIGAIVLATASGGKTNDNFTIPGTEAQRTADLLKAKVPALSGGQSQIVFAVSGAHQLTEPQYRTAIEKTLADLRTVPQVVPQTVTDPFQNGMIAGPDGKKQVALAQVQYTASAVDVKDSSLDKVKDAVQPARSAGVQVEFNGSVYPGWRTAISELPELIGLIIAFIILLIAFGAFVAAGLPIVNAIIGVVITLMGVTALASVITIASASTTVALMLGLSCGIDYGLFVLSRHRNNLLQGMELEESVGLAAGTAGSSVVFAAGTVIIALCGMSVVGIPFLTVMGLSAAAAVLIAMLIALTLMPAMLGFAGKKVEKFFSPPWRRGRPEYIARTAAEEPEKLFGSRWAGFVVRHRIPVLIIGVAVLAVLAIPALSIKLGLPGAGSEPKSTTQRQAYDLTTKAFGPGFNGALLVTADPVSSTATAAELAGTLAKVPDVLRATPALISNGVAVIQVIPKTGPNDTKTADLVHYIRDHRTAIEGDTGAKLLVGGTAASNIDVSSKLSSALPVFLIVVVGLAFVLLTFAFRTILVPIKSILGFLLSMAAAFGAQVAMFQWGWGEKLFGITKTETISFLPIIMLAIIFGLSSDYEVFVVSRIKEEFSKNGGDARAAVRSGTGASARVVTSAALIMFFIFVAFMINKDPTIKAIGFSFAVGVFLDAFVVRLTLVPAVMAIIGKLIWYHPRWYERYIPDPDIEGKHLEDELALAVAGPPSDPEPDARPGEPANV